ncbi:MAG: FHA domain-containing protein [Arenicella sp.]
MALLQNKLTEERIMLRVNHTFGRDPETNIDVLNSVAVSRNHAVIVWDGDFWKIKDFSTNGTFINDKPISSGVYHDLSPGVRLQFGHLPMETWEVVNLDPPMTCLLPLDPSLPLIPLHDVVVLPIESLEIIVSLSENGDWVCETGTELAVLQTGNKVGASGQFWQFVDGHPGVATVIADSPPPNEDIQFCFKVSQNEEHVFLSLMFKGKEYDLGERNHHYLLLLLARQRLEDRDKGLRESEQGWIKKETLSQMLGLIEQHINIQVHRVRKQVTAVLPSNVTLHQIVERRLGEIRFAYTNMHIEGGLEGPNQNSIAL